MIVLSYLQAREILAAYQQGQTAVRTSLDLGLTHIEMPLPSTMLSNEQLDEIANNEQVCYVVKEGAIEKIQRFSKHFNRFYSLMPTYSAPTMLVAGFPMHRIKGTDPYQDTLSKIKAIAPIKGTVLDTTMGLGYTAVQAAKTAVHVTTIELDPTVVDICRYNPWSQGLFNLTNLTRLIGSAYDHVATFATDQFTIIIHDPPTFRLAGDLYSADFYRQLHRILKPKGRLFHYIGDPQSKLGSRVTKGVVQRLKEAGFRRVVPRPRAYGVTAYK